MWAWAYRLEKIILQPPGRWFFQSSVQGIERVPESGPVIVVANHASFFDPWLLANHFPRNPISYLINEEWYRRSRLFTWFFDAHGVLPAARGEPVVTILRVRDALARGRSVGVFAEGRISCDGLMNRLRHGVGWMAALSGVPVVPCGLRGNFETWPRQRKLPRRHPVELRIGEPLHFPGAPVDEPAPEAVHDFVVRLAGAVCRLAGQADREEFIRPVRRPIDLRPRLREAAGTGSADPEGDREKEDCG